MSVIEVDQASNDLEPNDAETLEEALGQGVGLRMIGQVEVTHLPLRLMGYRGDAVSSSSSLRQFSSSENRPLQDRVKCKKFNMENTCER